MSNNLNKIKTVVLIPHYNNLSSLKKTIQSIKHPKGIDVLVIDDGSSAKQNPTIFLLEKYLNKNVQLQILRLEKNEGITHALNFGLEYILKLKKHQFIARIDCGDVCVSNRFKLQEEYLLANKDVDIVGSWVKWLDTKSGDAIFCKKPPVDHDKIKKQMSIRCSIIHPSAMFKLSVVEKMGAYPKDYEAAEDYAYFFTIANKGVTANIPKFLTSVEHSEKGISFTKRKEQSKSKLKIIYKHSPVNFNLLYGMTYNFLLMHMPKSTINKVKSKIFSN